MATRSFRLGTTHGLTLHAHSLLCRHTLIGSGDKHLENTWLHWKTKATLWAMSNRGYQVKQQLIIYTTASNGSLGSRVDEERSEVRKLMRPATRESSSFWTHIAPDRSRVGSACLSINNTQQLLAIVVVGGHWYFLRRMSNGIECLGLHRVSHLKWIGDSWLQLSGRQ